MGLPMGLAISRRWHGIAVRLTRTYMRGSSSGRLVELAALLAGDAADTRTPCTSAAYERQRSSVRSARPISQLTLTPSGKWLVQQHHGRVDGRRPGDRHALLHAARKLFRQGVA